MRLSDAMSKALVGSNFSPIPSKFSFHMKKKDLSLNLQSIMIHNLEPSQYCSCDITFL